MTDVLLATCADLPDGEPGHELLDAELERRGIDARWVCWDDDGVDWAAARLVAVRSTWDYVPRHRDFLDWVRRVDEETTLLNGAAVMEWNHDKRYLTELDGLPVVPTRLARTEDEFAAAITEFGASVVKPRVSAGGAGLITTDDPRDARLGTEIQSHPTYPAVGGPWIVQPLVESVRTVGESSVFVIDGRAVAQVDKLPVGDEVRVHEEFGGSSRVVPLTDEAAAVALRAMEAVGRRFRRALDYGRVDLMRLGQDLQVSELELIEPGLYLDVTDMTAAPFVDLLAARLA